MEHPSKRARRGPSPERVSWRVHRDASDPLDDATPSDTLAAVLLLLSEVSEMTTDAPKIIFKHQIYTIVEDRTSVDREVDRLCKNNQAQIFKFGPISDEYAVLPTHVYVDYVRQTVKGNAEDERVVEVYLKSLGEHHGVSITKADLTRHTKLGEDGVARLMNRGLLLHRDTVSYWTAIPNAGPVLGWMRKGRVEILAMLKRAKYREVLRRDLLKRKLRGSKLGMLFHIADVVGLGLVTSIKTTSGDLYRFKADGD